MCECCNVHLSFFGVLCYLLIELGCFIVVSDRNEKMLLIQFNSLELSTFLKFLGILVGGNHTLMLLSLLLEDQRFHIDILLFNF